VSADFAQPDLTVADVMLPAPKTLPAGISIATARSALENDHVQMLLLVDGAVFRGAVTEIPATAGQDEQALAYAETEPETMSVTESAALAFTRAKLNPHRRLVVLDQDRTLLGLVCLNATLTRFCGGAYQHAEPTSRAT
jgi:CBS-domain-containing membrane protein